MQTSVEDIIRRRMHGLYLTRPCACMETLAHELLGLHSWFGRNVPFSLLIRGAGIFGWKTALTKTWLYRGTLHGVLPEDLPELLAVSAGEEKDGYFSWLAKTYGKEKIETVADEVLSLMEDGVYSRTEFRQIFAERYDPDVIDRFFSPWGGIFVYLAQLGKVAFRDMTSRDFDLIEAEPSQSFNDVLPGLLKRYFTAYGPATLSDAVWFFGISKEDAKKLPAIESGGLQSFELNRKTYYHSGSDPADIPELTLLAGFDPVIASYTPDNRLIIPQEHKKKVILSSGICLPTVVVKGKVAGIWNIKKKEPVVEFFSTQPKKMKTEALERVESIIWGLNEGGK
jgi:hypothetical protein